MDKKKSIFSSSKPYYSQYYSKRGKALQRRKRAIKQYVGGAKEGIEAHDRYKAIMDNVKKSDRDEVRGMDYDDVFEAADALVDEAKDMWTAEDLENYIINLEESEESGGKTPF